MSIVSGTNASHPPTPTSAHLTATDKTDKKETNTKQTTGNENSKKNLLEKPKEMSFNYNNINASVASAILMHVTQQNIETRSKSEEVAQPNTPREDLAAETRDRSSKNSGVLQALVSDKSGSDLFARIETAEHGTLAAADGLMCPTDLKLAIHSGGLTEQERAIAQYLLDNFDTLKTGDYITRESINSFAQGMSLASDGQPPLQGLASLRDKIDMQNDLFSIAQWSSGMNREALEKWSHESDLSAAEREAADYLLTHFDTVSQGDDRVSPQDIHTFLSGLTIGEHANELERLESYEITTVILGQLNMAAASLEELQGLLNIGVTQGKIQDLTFTPRMAHALRQSIENFSEISDGQQVVTDTLESRGGDIIDGMKELAENPSLLKPDRQHGSFSSLFEHDLDVTKADVENTIKNDQLSKSEIAALRFILKNYESIAGPDGLLEIGDIRDAYAKMESIGTFEKSYDQATQKLEYARSQVGSFEQTARNSDLYARLNSTVPNNVFTQATRQVGTHHTPESREDDITRNELQAALNSDKFTESEKSFIRIILSNFSQIGGRQNAISQEQITHFTKNYVQQHNDSFQNSKQPSKDALQKV